MKTKDWVGLVGIFAVVGLLMWGLEVEPFRPWCEAAFMLLGAAGIIRAWPRRHESWLQGRNPEGQFVTSPFMSVSVALAALSNGLSKLLQNDLVAHVGPITILIALGVARWNWKRKTAPEPSRWLF